MKKPPTRPIVITFGCQRSGTTLMRKWLNSASGFISIKLGESNMAHPAWSDKGLLALGELFKEQDSVLFVRIVREPMAVMRSHYGLDKIEKRSTEYGEHNLKPRLRNIEQERTNTAKQRNAKIKGSNKSLRIVELCYERLGIAKYQKKAVNAIIEEAYRYSTGQNAQKAADSKHLLRWIRDSYGTTPVRDGILKRGISVELSEHIVRAVEKLTAKLPEEQLL